MKNKDTTVKQMFSSIAPRYDLLNHLLSAGIDISWRKRAVDLLTVGKGTYLDVATGTCDVLLEILKKEKDITVFGIDFSLPMLKIGQEKIKNSRLTKKALLHYGDAQQLPFKNNSFKGSIIAFGLRNVSDRKSSLNEMKRVVKTNGKIIILEFTLPKNPVIKMIYSFYFTKILPFVGGIISGKKSAYQYLPSSVIEFPSPKQLKQLMEEIGLKDVTYEILTFGIASIHVGVKK